MDTVETRITAKSDEELLEIVEQTYNDYTPQALNYAMEELKRRQIPFVDQSANHLQGNEKQGEAAPEEILYCSRCKTAMQPGNIYLGSNMGGFFLSGLSYKQCYFQPGEPGKKEFKVVGNKEEKKAYYCKNCGLITFKIRG
jgi:hypothetical protein